MQQKQFSTKIDGKLVFFEMLKGKTKIHQNQVPAILMCLSFQSKHGNLQSIVSHDYDQFFVSGKLFNKYVAQPRGKY